MNHNVLIISGLDDVDHYGRFVANCLEEGINAEVYAFGWQNKDETLEELKRRFLGKIDSFAGLGALSLVGVSAGGCAVAWGLQQRPEIVDTAVNVCGALQMPRESHLNRFFSHKYEVLFNSMVSQLEPNSITDARLTSIRPVYDGIVRRSALEFGGSKIIETWAPFHPLAIAHALKYIVPDLLKG